MVEHVDELSVGLSRRQLFNQPSQAVHWVHPVVVQPAVKIQFVGILYYIFYAEGNLSNLINVFSIILLKTLILIFCFPLARTRLVCSTILSHCPLSSKQGL